MGNFNVSLTDALNNAEVLLHQGEYSSDSSGPLVKTRVFTHLTDEKSKIISQPNPKIELNTTMYEVEFPDGQRDPCAEEIYSAVDTDGRRDLIFQDTIDHRYDSNCAFKNDDEFYSHKRRKGQ